MSNGLQFLDELCRLLCRLTHEHMNIVSTSKLAVRAEDKMEGMGLHFKFLAVRIMEPRWWSSMRVRIWGVT